MRDNPGKMSVLLSFADILLDDGYEGNLRKEGRSFRIIVTNADSSNKTKVTDNFNFACTIINASCVTAML